MKRSLTAALCAATLLGSAAVAAPPAKAPAKAPAKDSKATKAQPAFATGVFASFQKVLSAETLTAIQAYYESLKATDRRAFMVLARGVLRVSKRLSDALAKAGKSGLGIEELLVRSARQLLKALSERKYKHGAGAIRWTFARFKNLTDRLRAVLNESGAGGTGFVKMLEGVFERMKKRVRGVAGGKRKWVPGQQKKKLSGFRTKLIAAYKQVVSKLKPNLAKAKAAWTDYLEGFVDAIGMPSTRFLDRYITEYRQHEKTLTAWFKKFPKRSKEKWAHIALLRGLGSLMADARIAVAAKIGRGGMVAMTGVAGILSEIMAAAAKKNLALGKGIEKFITDALAKWPAVWAKALASKKIDGKPFGAFINKAFMAEVKGVLAKANEVLAGKKKHGAGKTTWWFRAAIERLAKAFPANVNAKAFAGLFKGQPPKAIIDFVASLGK